jgi:hypothetical protein
MPVVLTDHTNGVWCVEQPDDGLLHVGLTGYSGPTLLDTLEFIATRQKQFDKFVEKRKEKKNETKRRLRHSSSNTRDAESGGDFSVGEK